MSDESDSSSHADSRDKPVKAIQQQKKEIIASDYTSPKSPRIQIRRRLKVIPGLKVPRYAEEYRQQCVTAEGIRLCCHCRKPGHFVFTCYQLAREQGIEIRTTKRRESAPAPSTVAPVEVQSQDN